MMQSVSGQVLKILKICSNEFSNACQPDALSQAYWKTGYSLSSLAEIFDFSVAQTFDIYWTVSIGVQWYRGAEAPPQLSEETGRTPLPQTIAFHDIIIHNT